MTNYRTAIAAQGRRLKALGPQPQPASRAARSAVDPNRRSDPAYAASVRMVGDEAAAFLMTMKAARLTAMKGPQ